MEKEERRRDYDDVGVEHRAAYGDVGVLGNHGGYDVGASAASVVHEGHSYAKSAQGAAYDNVHERFVGEA